MTNMMTREELSLLGKVAKYMAMTRCKGNWDELTRYLNGDKVSVNWLEYDNKLYANLMVTYAPGDVRELELPEPLFGAIRSLSGFPEE